MELPKTEQELQQLINDAVKVAVDELTSKHNGEMATLRTKHASELKKVKEEVSMSAEEIAQKRAEEMAQANAQELAELRTFKRSAIIKDKLASAGLPTYFVNDSRLLSAEEGDIDKVIKTVKSEYDATLPKGNTHSSVVQTGANPPQDTQGQVYEQVGNAIGNLFKK